MRKQKIRVAKYKRVSHDEQKLKKNSIIAQDELLDKYIADHPDMVLVGDFSDEAVSGTKLKRTELQSLLEMVESREVDVILVTKLDRWFRNVAFYYKVQEILERNGVAWQAILEEYNTLTADGKLKVNIMLSVAQNETDRTSERIVVVFDSKVKHKQAISGSQPLGFTTADGNGVRIVVKDPNEEPIVNDLIDRVKITHSLRGSLLYINDKYERNISYNSVHRLMKNTMLYGEYKGVADYCPAYITKTEFEELQKIISRNIKVRDTNRIYMFSGMLLCPICGRRLAGTYAPTKKSNGKVYQYLKYRCPSSRQTKSCDYKKAVSENVIERKVLDQVLPQLESLMIEADIQSDHHPPRVNKKAIKAEMSRLNKMYEKGRIDEDEYDRKYEALEKKLAIQEEPQKDYTELKELLNADFKTLYKTFDNREKQMFWRSIIDTIELKGDQIVINFL